MNIFDIIGPIMIGPSSSHTAGSCGIVPAVLLTFQEQKNIPDDKVVMSLLSASGIGMVIAKNASISGAEGGC